MLGLRCGVHRSESVNTSSFTFCQAKYSMKNVPLASTEKEVDLDVVISKALKPSQHCTETVKTANKLVGFIGRIFEFESEKVILA